MGNRCIDGNDEIEGRDLPLPETGEERWHDEFRQALEEFGAKFVVISGSWDERKSQAVEAVEANHEPRTTNHD